MKEEHIWTKKPETMLDWFCVVGACIALYLTLNNLGYFLGKIGAVSYTHLRAHET